LILLSFDINDTLVDLLIVLIIHLILPIINNIHYKTTLPETGCYLSYLIIYSYQTSRYHIDFYNIILISCLPRRSKPLSEYPY
jgi:competence protein ComGC